MSSLIDRAKEEIVSEIQSMAIATSFTTYEEIYAFVRSEIGHRLLQERTPTFNDLYLTQLSRQFLVNLTDLNNDLEKFERVFKAEKETGSTKKARLEPPLYTLSKSQDIRVVLKEYFEGIEGNCSVQSLERTYGSKWRGGSKHAISKQYGRRKNLYMAVERALDSGDYTLDELVAILQKARTFKNGSRTLEKSINWLCCNLPDLLKAYLNEHELKIHNHSRDHQ